MSTEQTAHSWDKVTKADASGSYARCQRKAFHVLHASITSPQLSSAQLAPLLHPKHLLFVHMRKTEKEKQKKKPNQNRRDKVGNKAITLQPRGRNCSFNDKILDDKSDENSDDGENHKEEERALLVGQAPPGAARLRRRPRGQACCAAAARDHLAALLGEGHGWAVGAAQLRSILALSDGAHAEAVVAVGLQALDVEGRARAFVELGTRRGRGEDEEWDSNLGPLPFVWIFKRGWGWSLFTRNASAVFSSSPPAFLYLFLAEKKLSRVKRLLARSPSQSCSLVPAQHKHIKYRPAVYSAVKLGQSWLKSDAPDH